MFFAILLFAICDWVWHFEHIYIYRKDGRINASVHLWFSFSGNFSSNHFSFRLFRFSSLAHLLYVFFIIFFFFFFALTQRWQGSLFLGIPVTRFSIPRSLLFRQNQQIQFLAEIAFHIFHSTHTHPIRSLVMVRRIF